MATTENELRGLNFSAAELKQMTGWPFPLIEDYLTVRDDIVTVGGNVDEKEDILKDFAIVTAANTPYTPTADDRIILCDITSVDVYVTLPAGVEGRNYRIVGFGSNTGYVTPNGTELLYGGNATEYIKDQESLRMTFKTTYGWV